MSQIDIRQALEIALNSISPSIDIAWENKIYKPIDGSPYVAVYLLPAEPLNPETGVGGFFQEQGIFQLNLSYPANIGAGIAEARAELLRTVFFQGAQFTRNATNVMVTRTPAISQGRVDGDRWTVPVKIRYLANGSS